MDKSLTPRRTFLGTLAGAAAFFTGTKVLSFTPRPSKQDDGYITIYIPAGFPPNQFEAMRLTEPIADWHARAGDVCVVYLTTDIQKGDVVCITGKPVSDDSTGNYVGLLDFDDYYYHLTEDSEYEDESFHRTQAHINGRVISIQREGKDIQTPLYLRWARG